MSQKFTDKPRNAENRNLYMYKEINSMIFLTENHKNQSQKFTGICKLFTKINSHTVTHSLQQDKMKKVQ